jgi:hypothetical protein
MRRVMASLARGRIKGVSFLSARRYVDRAGNGGWARVLGRMPEGDRRIADEALPVGWYDMAVYSSLLRAIDDEMGNGTLSTARPLGRFQAEHDLNVFYRLVLRFWSPAILIEKTAEMWSRYHDTGVWTVTRDGERRVDGAVTGWLGSSDIMCPVVGAYVERLFELVGAKSARAHHPDCGARAGQVCRWVVDWE